MKLEPFYIVQVEEKFIPRFNYAGRLTKKIDLALAMPLSEAKRLSKKHNGKIIKVSRKWEYI